MSKKKEKIIKRFDVWLVSLDPALGSETKKTRPAVVLSPDIINQKLQTVIAAPLTTTIKGYPSHIPSAFGNIAGEIMLDQLRSIDKSRLVKKLGNLDKEEAFAACQVLEVMFAY